MCKSILAGVIISMSATVSLCCSDKVVGALLFSLGLTLILVLELSLYTGKVGYISRFRDVPELVGCLYFNVLGVLLFRCLLVFANSAILESVLLVADVKKSMDIVQMCFRAIPCGALMYMGVESYKRTKNILLPMLCVTVFIVSGYEHCIVVFFYAPFSIQFVTAVLGNSVGSILTRLLVQGGSSSGEEKREDSHSERVR